jgi:copper chaperone
MPPGGTLTTSPTVDRSTGVNNRFASGTPTWGMNRHTLSVVGMACDGCEQNVERALQKLEGVASVTADHEADSVEVLVSDDTADEELTRAIREAGYDTAA